MARARIKSTEHSRGRVLLNQFPAGHLWSSVLIFSLEKQVEFMAIMQLFFTETQLQGGTNNRMMV